VNIQNSEWDIYWGTATQLARQRRWGNSGKVGFRQPGFED